MYEKIPRMRTKLALQFAAAFIKEEMNPPQSWIRWRFLKKEVKKEELTSMPLEQKIENKQKEGDECKESSQIQSLKLNWDKRGKR